MHLSLNARSKSIVHDHVVVTAFRADLLLRDSGKKSPLQEVAGFGLDAREMPMGMAACDWGANTIQRRMRTEWRGFSLMVQFLRACGYCTAAIMLAVYVQIIFS